MKETDERRGEDVLERIVEDFSVGQGGFLGGHFHRMPVGCSRDLGVMRTPELRWYSTSRDSESAMVRRIPMQPRHSIEASL